MSMEDEEWEAPFPPERNQRLEEEHQTSKPKELAARLPALEAEVSGRLRAWLASPAETAEKTSSLAMLSRYLANKCDILCRDFAEALEEDREKKKLNANLVELVPAIRAMCWGLLALFPHRDNLQCLNTIVHYPTPNQASLGHLKQLRAVITAVGRTKGKLCAVTATERSLHFGRTGPLRANRLVELALADKELPFATLVEACLLYPNPDFPELYQRAPQSSPSWAGEHLLALRRACLCFGPYAFMGPALAMLVEYALAGLAWSSLESDVSLQDDYDWRHECVNILSVHLRRFNDEVRTRVIDSLPSTKIKDELKAQENETFKDLTSLLASLGVNPKAFEWRPEPFEERTKAFEEELDEPGRTGLSS